MTPFEIAMAVVMVLLIAWVIFISYWVLKIKGWAKTKASVVVTQHKGAMESQHPGGPPGDWPPQSLPFP